MELQSIKQRFGIIGNNPELNRALDIAAQVAPTDISVLVIGESGVGKEHIPQVIHALSSRKHGPYIAVNCGAIPEAPLTANFLDMKKARLLVQTILAKVILRWQTKVRFFWTKLPSCR